MSVTGNSTPNGVLGASTVASSGTLLANTGTASTWIVLTATIALGLSITTIALRLFVSVKR